MKIKQACTQPFCLAVDNAKDLGFFPFGQSNEAHEGQRNCKVIEMTKPMLAIDLRENPTCVGGNLKPTLGARQFLKTPGPIVPRPNIKGKWYSRGRVALNIFSK